MTLNELKVRLDLLQENILNRFPPLSIKERAELLAQYSAEGSREVPILFDTVEQEVNYLVAKAEKSLGWSRTQ